MKINEEDWRKLAEQVATESDPDRLGDLLDQLIQALDARRQSLQEKSIHKLDGIATSRTADE